MVTRGGWLGLAVLLVTLPGCVHEIPFNPATSRLKTPIPGGNERQVIVSAPFADARQITNRCGMAKHPVFGPDTPIVLCAGDPTQWISSLLASELRASGFTVLPTEGGARDSALKVEGILLRIFAEVVHGWTSTVETDLNVKLVATSRTGLRAERAFFVKGEGTSWTLERQFKDSVENGIRELVAKMVEAILDLMSQYPELGFRHHYPAVVAWRLERGR